MLIDDADEEKALFLSYSGKRISLRSVEKIVERYWKLSGLAKKVTPRTLRHSFASHLLGRGAKSCFVQGFLGHKRLVTTEKYLRIDIKHLKALHKKYHPRALIEEINIQPREDIAALYNFGSLMRY